MQNCTNPVTPGVGHDGLVAIITATATSVAGIIGAVIINNRQSIINFISGLICKSPVAVDKPKEIDLEAQTESKPTVDITLSEDIQNKLKEKIPELRTRSRSNSLEPQTPKSSRRVSIELDREKQGDVVIKL